MQILYDKINPNYSQLKRYITSNAAKELSAISEPCYYPKTKKFYFELLNILKIKDKDMKEFVKRTYKGTKAEKFKLTNDVGTNILVFIMHYFLSEKQDQAAFSATMVYFMIIQYSRLMNKQIKYCDPNAFKYTLDTLTRTHLFFREKSISNGLYYLARQIQTNYQNDIKNWDIDKIIAFLSASRTRISQSIKSFARSYYDNKKSGAMIKTQGELTDDENTTNYQYEVLEKGQKIIDDVTKKITLYKVVDRKAFDEAKKISKIKTSIATVIINNLSNEDHINNIKIALQLYVKSVKTADMLCGNSFYTHVKRLMAIKRTIAQLYFKAQINILLLEILKDTNLLKTYQGYTSQTQFIINSFLAFYLTLMIRRTVCNV